MKTQDEILKRLRKLRVRYLRLYAKESQSRCPSNCKWNHTVSVPVAKSSISGSTSVVSGPGFERPVASSHSTSIVVLSESDPFVHVCIYGSENPSLWNGELCYTTEKASSCSWFKPVIQLADIENEFCSLLSDDNYVVNNYPDIAALQWVISDRIYRHKLRFFERVILFIFRFRTRIKPVLKLSEISELEHDSNNTSERDIDLDVLENEDFDPKLKNLFR